MAEYNLNKNDLLERVCDGQEVVIVQSGEPETWIKCVVEDYDRSFIRIRKSSGILLIPIASIMRIERSY